ncbi:nucleoside-diphosphate-sugar epimerase [Brevundimonas alba]|uniref:Nucleoside-diphosphate-sugar epimerase n=1 Tax=Brevundimonas alba TaxID=74314 RepID=A0A7X5YLA4_9CAUL|nr:NAD(P)-dependent oxidoreductase [Brevundimonas alba]NJC41296.1 nucleoside-diphosphate-sugar epimerase [Brevundimonas alba]
MRVLITGSSGFVGKALMARLVSTGHEVRGFSRRAAPDTLQGDLLNPASLREALAGFQPEVIYNLAAETDLKGAPKGGYAVNIEGVRNLLDAVAEAPSVSRVIWMSSQLVNRPGRTPKTDTDYDPEGGYGASKVEGEKLVRADEGAGRTWVIVRSTTIWGPGMSEHYLGVLRLIRRGVYFHVGRKPRLKSYSYIETLASQLEALGVAPAETVHGRTFYLADSPPIDLRAWSDSFAARFGRRIAALPEPVARALGLIGDGMAMIGLRAPLTSKRLSNMMAEYVYDTAPIDSIAGLPVVSMEEGVRRTADWLEARDGTVAKKGEGSA